MPHMRQRLAGVLAPLFSMPSSSSWGIGEIGDIPLMARWLESAGLRLLQLLPINEMPPGQTSPYSALSAMAIDPQFIAVEQLEDFASIARRVESGLRERIEAVRRLGHNRLRARPGAEGNSATSIVRAFSRDRMGIGDAPVGGLPCVHQRPELVARRLRPVPRAARTAWRATLAALAPGASRQGSGCTGSGPRRAGGRGVVSAVSSVGRRRSVGRCASRCAERRAVWRSSVHGRWRQRGRMGATGRISP